jgi:hypothetical protein
MIGVAVASLVFRRQFQAFWSKSFAHQKNEFVLPMAEHHRASNS